MRSIRPLYILGGGLLLAIAVCLVLGAGFVLRYQSLDSEADFALPAPDVADLTYCTMEGLPQQLDLYLPRQEAGALLPLAVYVHGGAFTGGDKRKGSSAIDIPAMVQRGYAVAAINYRLAPQHKFPDPLQDVKCAIRFLRAQAATYGLDSNRVGIWGASAGGYLAAFAGLTGSRQDLDSGPYLDQSSSVKAVADLFGPTDLTASDFNLLQKLLLYRAFGTISSGDPFLASASPINHITTAPPFLIMHGELDDAVPVSQSRSLHQRLQSAGVPSTLILVKNANHEFAPTGGPISPSRAELSQRLADFFDAHLNEKP